MKVLFTTTCKPIPMLLGKYLSTDQTLYRFVVDQDLFSVSSFSPAYSLHFMAQNINVPSVVLEWPTVDELADELRSDFYDYVGISFRSIDLEKLPEMIKLIRQVSPQSKIVIGGYGTLGLEDFEEEGIYIRDKVDYICQGEGVQFMRSLLGDNEERTMICHLPLEVIKIPWLPASEKIGYILSALGCPMRCEFCATSAYTGGRLVEVMTAPEIFESIKWYCKTYPELFQVFIMDENFLAYKKKVNALGKLIRKDEETNLSRISYLAFGTALALSKWEPDELLLNGVSEVWSGIESFYSDNRKKRKVDVKDLFSKLQKHGIRVQLSWIIGDDCQNQENIDSDIEQFIALSPVTAQLSILSANRGTALYRRLKKEGRAQPFCAEEAHLLGNSVDSLHFSHEERLDRVFKMYRKLYETHGPTLMRGVKTDIDGYKYCVKSKNPYLNGPKLEYFKKRIRNSIPLVKTAIAFSPNPTVKKLMEDLEQEYVELFGTFTKSQRMGADYILSLAEKEHKKREAEGGYPYPNDIPLQRYAYPGR